jgi:arylsulfatase
MATAIDASGVSYPTEDKKGRPLPPYEGQSLLGVLQGEKPSPRSVFIEHDGNRGVVTEKWKLTADTGENWHLFDLDVDRFERNNVADQYPGVVKELIKQWEIWATKVGAREDGGRPHKRKHLFEEYRKRIEND